MKKSPLARPEMIDEMEMPPEEEMAQDEADMASMSDIEDMTATNTAAGEMNLSAIPDEVLQAELAKRRGGKPPMSAGVLPPQEVTGTESSNMSM